MKIAILADPLDNQSAGVHRYTKELVNALERLQKSGESKHEYLIVRQKKDESLQFKQLSIPSINLPIGFASLRLFAIIPAILRRHHVDAVFEPAHFGPFNLPASIKRVTMIHDLTPIKFPELHRYHSQQLQRKFLPGILDKADLILCNSENTKEDLRELFPGTKDKTKRIYLGVSDHFTPSISTDSIEKMEIRQAYFCCVGTIEPRKDLLCLLEAYRKFRELSTEKVQLIIGGQEGWKTAAFFEALKKHIYRDDIILTGFLSEEALRELYSHSLALIYPSKYEGFGLPILEAMACSCHVICSRNSSLVEVGGKIAYFFETGDAGDLAEQMIRVNQANENEAIQRKSQGVEWSKTFSWDNYALEFERAFTSLENTSKESPS